jgi:hypothetical protein
MDDLRNKQFGDKIKEMSEKMAEMIKNMIAKISGALSRSPTMGP